MCLTAIRNWARVAGAQIRFFLVDELHGGRARLQQGAIAIEVREGLVARRFGVSEIGLGLGDFRRLAAAPQIGELIARLPQLPRDLIGRGFVVRIVLVEQGFAFDDLIAALNVNGDDEPFLRRSDFDEIGVGIALPGDDPGTLRAQKEPPAGEADANQRDH